MHARTHEGTLTHTHLHTFRHTHTYTQARTLTHTHARRVEETELENAPSYLIAALTSTQEGTVVPRKVL